MPNNGYFQGNPVSLDISRSKLNTRPRWTGTWKVGELVPIFATSSVLPGSTYQMSVSSAIRMSKMVFPVMDDCDITIEAYFVPHRLVLSRQSMSPAVDDANHSWTAFIGAQDSLLNMPLPGSVTLPSCTIGNSVDTQYLVGGLADAFGYPDIGVTGTWIDVNPFKFLSYYSIWNEFWRDPNTMTPVTFSIADNVCYLYGSDAGISDNEYLSLNPLAPVSRFHSYFGSALPWPQRNSTQVQLPLGSDAPLKVGNLYAIGNPVFTNNTLQTDSVARMLLSGNQAHGHATFLGYKETTDDYSLAVNRTNLYADLSAATAATVSQFRFAVQLQRYYEALARCGNKYYDLVNGIWGVRNVGTMDRPEYLGGFTAPINVSQVANTASSLGQVGAVSLSNPGGFLFNKSFTEHGTIMVLACVRLKDSFYQGVSREDTKFDRLDFYVPQFANLGEQPILNKELFVSGTEETDEAVFGYQEAWAEYRYDCDRVTGFAKPITGGLGYLTYVNDFASSPTLKGFLDATGQQTILDRSLAVSGSSAGLQFYGQFEFQITKVLPMPLYSIPGLVDHH